MVEEKQTEKRKRESVDGIAAKKAKWTAKNPKKDGKKEFPKKGKDGQKKGKEKEPVNRKEIKKNRKIKENPNYETEMSIKKMWAILRNAENAEDREKNVDQIFERVKKDGKSLSDFAFAHDTTRVLQSCLQHGNAGQRRFIYDSLKEKVPEMAQSKYAKNVVIKLIKYGERDIKDHCIENMGNVRKLVRSATGQSVLEYAYNQFAQSKQRNDIVSKLYGKSWNRLSKTDKQPTLISVIEKNTDFVETIITDFMEDLKALTEKEVMQQTVSHRGFLDFFNLCLFLLHSEDDTIKQKRKRIEEIRSELIEELKASVIHMIHTPDGARVGLHCIWFGSAKDRKLILKTMKEFLVKVVTAESGHLLALGAIDAVDDTVLVKKMLISPICKEMDELMKDKCARKVIWYILNDRDPRAFLPDVVKLLEIGDQSVTCKKPRHVKYSELKSTAMPHILEWFSENLDLVFSDAGLLPMLACALGTNEQKYILKDNENMLNTVHQAMAKKLNGDYSSESHPLALKGVAWFLRKVLSFDQEKEENKLCRAISQICKDNFHLWLADNRGCFLILQLLEANDAETIEIVKNSIGEKLVSNRDQIAKTSGGALLLKKALDEQMNFRTIIEVNKKENFKKEKMET